MSLADLVILAAVVLCAVFALRSIRKKGGNCTGNCAECRARKSAACEKKKDEIR